MTFRDVARQIYAAVEARGYTRGWTRQQLIARQLVKLAEEVGEASQYAILDPEMLGDQPRNAFDWHVDRLAVLARERFNAADWEWCGTVSDFDELNIADELADVYVVVCMLAHLLGVDVQSRALDKAQADIARGVRNG